MINFIIIIWIFCYGSSRKLLLLFVENKARREREREREWEREGERERKTFSWGFCLERFKERGKNSHSITIIKIKS